MIFEFLNDSLYDYWDKQQLQAPQKQ